MAFTALTASQTDADSPLDQSLFDTIRTNLDDLDASRVTNGDSHDHEGGDGGTIGAGGISAVLGAWASKTPGTTYQAATDGFVVAHNSTTTVVIGYTDSSATPTTVRTRNLDNATSPNYAGVCFPVKKDDYYKVTGASTMYWIPLGS